MAGRFQFAMVMNIILEWGLPVCGLPVRTGEGGTILGFSEAVVLVGIGLKIGGVIANAQQQGLFRAQCQPLGQWQGCLAAICPPVTTCYRNGAIVS